MFFLREWRTAVTEKGGIIPCILVVLVCALLLNRLINSEAMAEPWLWVLPIPGIASIALDAIACLFLVFGIVVAERGAMAKVEMD